MDNELAELERTLGGLVRNMEIGEQRKLLRRMATKLKKSQADRIARQQGPDGSAFTPRRKPKEPEAAKHPLKFLYPEGGSPSGGATAIVTRSASRSAIRPRA